MKRYRLYTEAKNVDTVIIPELKASLESATFFYGHGIWKGTQERSLIIEVIHLKGFDPLPTLYALADRINNLNGQEACLITAEDIQAELIEQTREVLPID